jgi:hypothetical protein
MADSSPFIYDLIGIGFGPSNVAIAGALIEKWHSVSFGIILYISHKFVSSKQKNLSKRPSSLKNTPHFNGILECFSQAHRCR